VSDDLDAVAGELYALPPGEFTAARNARAVAATGDLGRRIKALKKPSVAAWAVNLLVRDGQLAEAVELSSALHEAQEDLDAAELAKLGRQRRALVAGLARRASELAGAAGAPLSLAARDEVERSINAAIVDAAAASAVLSGRLVRTIGTGDDADPGDAVAGSLAGVPARPAPSRDDLAERRARKAAEAAAREAARAASDAERERARVAARVEKTRERADHLHERIEELRADLERVSADAERVDAELERLEDEHGAASAAARAAREEADRLHRRLEDGA
jgi:outer membrane murein-binding lipoprotein Lpp